MLEKENIIIFWKRPGREDCGTFYEPNSEEIEGGLTVISQGENIQPAV